MRSHLRRSSKTPIFLRLSARRFLLLGLTLAPVGLAGQSVPTSATDVLNSASEASDGVAAPRVRASSPAPLNASTDLADIEIDGVLDEPDWAAARVFGGFTQQEPVEGAPAEHDTEVRVLFGDDAIWIAARMWDTDPEIIGNTQKGVDARLAASRAFDLQQRKVNAINYAIQSAAGLEGRKVMILATDRLTKLPGLEDGYGYVPYDREFNARRQMDSVVRNANAASVTAVCRRSGVATTTASSPG